MNYSLVPGIHECILLNSLQPRSYIHMLYFILTPLLQLLSYCILTPVPCVTLGDGANMGPTWVLLSAPDGPHVGSMNLAIRVVLSQLVMSPWGQGLLFGYPIFKWVVVTWQGWEGTRIVSSAMTARRHTIFRFTIHGNFALYDQGKVANYWSCTVEIWEWISNFIPHFIKANPCQ